MLTRILVATDGSEHAGRAVAAGGELAGRLGAKLMLTHVVVAAPDSREVSGMAKLMKDLGPSPSFAPMHMDELVGLVAEQSGRTHVRTHREALREIGQQLLKRAEQEAQGGGARGVELDLREGSPAEEIVRSAEAREADLILLGSKGLGGTRHKLMGDVARKVTSHAPVSCMIVR